MRAKRMVNTDGDDNTVTTNENKVIIETMSVYRLPEGVVMYGCVQQISDFELKLSTDRRTGVA